MKYFSKETFGFYDSLLHKQMPEDVVEISDTTYYELMEGQCNGKQISIEGNAPILIDPLNSLENRKTTEILWRDSELKRADEELNKVQDSDPKAVGSVGDWRNYRKLLRAWPEDLNFLNKEFRPKAPDWVE